MNYEKVNLVGNWVLIKPQTVEEEKKSQGGIFIPNPIHNGQKQVGTVLEVGPGKKSETVVEPTPMVVKPGDKVWFDRYNQVEGIVYNGVQCIMVTEDKIFGVVSE